jgi:hypothetical protein
MQKNQIKYWYTYLELIRRRPFMYNVQKVEDIFLLSCGYSEALERANAIDEDLQHFFDGFMNFVIADYNAPVHCNWCTAIRLYSVSDNASVDLFFEELAKYKSGEKDFDRVRYRQENQSFCCKTMADKIEESLDAKGEIKYHDADVVINKQAGKYGLPVHDGGTSIIEISHCPWCGTKLK